MSGLTPRHCLAVFGAAAVMSAAPAQAQSDLVELVCAGKTTSVQPHNKVFRTTFYVDVTAHSYCEDNCSTVAPLSAWTQDTISMSWVPDKEAVINTVGRDLAFNWRTRRMTGHVEYNVSYHERYDVNATCDVRQVEFYPVIKFFSDARKH